MNRKRQKQVEEIAVATLRQCNCYPATANKLINEGGINVQQVASKLGVELMLYDFGDDVSGVLLRDGEKAKIGYTTKNGPRRQRFTIAHELGHFVLNHQRQGVFIDTPEKYFTLFRDTNSATGEDFQEREANAFAAALLMPRDLLIEAAKALSHSGITREEDYDIIPILANEFNVSKLAMTIRLTNLDLVW